MGAGLLSLGREAAPGCCIRSAGQLGNRFCPRFGMASHIRRLSCHAYVPSGWDNLSPLPYQDHKGHGRRIAKQRIYARPHQEPGVSGLESNPKHQAWGCFFVPTEEIIGITGIVWGTTSSSGIRRGVERGLGWQVREDRAIILC